MALETNTDQNRLESHPVSWFYCEKGDRLTVTVYHSCKPFTSTITVKRRLRRPFIQDTTGTTWNCETGRPTKHYGYPKQLTGRPLHKNTQENNG